jgi:hypothetical protein
MPPPDGEDLEDREEEWIIAAIGTAIDLDATKRKLTDNSVKKTEEALHASRLSQLGHPKFFKKEER